MGQCNNLCDQTKVLLKGVDVLLNAAGTTVSIFSKLLHCQRVSGLVVVGGDTQLQLLAIPLKSCSPRDVSGMSFFVSYTHHVPTRAGDITCLAS
jgi:hypothetical protein